MVLAQAVQDLVQVGRDCAVEAAGAEIEVAALDREAGGKGEPAAHEAEHQVRIDDSASGARFHGHEALGIRSGSYPRVGARAPE